MSAPEPTDLSTRLEEALSGVRERHGRRSQAETRIDGNVVTCTSSTATSIATGPTPAHRVAASGEVDAEAYVTDAVEAVVRITRQRVSRFSSFTRGPHGIVEIFTLESSTGRGQPRARGA